MVKRIKKRIEKVEDETELGENDAIEEVQHEGGLAAELAAADDDQFTRKTASAIQWIVDHRGLLIAATAVACIGVGIYAYTHRQKAAGSEEATASFMVGADAYQKYVEGIFGQANEGEPAEDLTARLTKAESAFAATRAAYPSSGLAELAGLGLAGSQFEQGKYDEALKNYVPVTTAANADPLLKAVALHGKAAAESSKGDFAGAIATWKSLEALSGEAFGLAAAVEIARLQERMGKPAEAKATYEKAKSDHEKALESFTNRNYKSEIERGLSRLGQAT